MKYPEQIISSYRKSPNYLVQCIHVINPKEREGKIIYPVAYEDLGYPIQIQSEDEFCFHSLSHVVIYDITYQGFKYRVMEGIKPEMPKLIKFTVAGITL